MAYNAMIQVFKARESASDLDGEINKFLSDFFKAGSVGSNEGYKVESIKYHHSTIVYSKDIDDKPQPKHFYSALVFLEKCEESIFSD